MHETSYISAPAKEKTFKILDESSIKYFNLFIEFANNILKSPKSELREIQELKKLNQVRPTPRTFMEIVTKGFSKELTSRAYKETYNVSENQYVLFVVNSTFNLLNNMGKVSNYISTSLQEKIKDEENRRNSFTDTIKINSEAVRSDYYEQKSKVKKERNLVDSILKNQTKINKSVNLYDRQYNKLKLGKKPVKEKDELAFFLHSGIENSDRRKYYILKFNSEWKDLLKEYRTYYIKGKITYNENEYIKYDENNEPQVKVACIIGFEYIEELRIIDSKEEEKYFQLQEQVKKLKKNNWVRPITYQERKEQNQEIQEINEIIKSASKKLKSSKQLSDKLHPTLNKIRKTQRKFAKLSISPISSFPDSMSFVQNPDYQGVHKVYKEIQSLSGMDSNVFEGLEKAEEIGILNTSLLYERWCLLQIIKVIIDKFGFIPEEKWKNKLLNQIINKNPDSVRDVSLIFENSKTNRKIVLGYEKNIKTNKGEKRPDFILDLISNYHQDNPKETRLILDAKFKENINSIGGISKVINELYNEKDYSQLSKNKNTVFILHPSLKSVPKIKTPQEWSENSYFGETKQFDWDSEHPNHRYGAIMLSPIQNKSKYLDNLQMCIGMFLQYDLENNKLNPADYVIEGSSVDNVLNPIPVEKLFCIVCGHDQFTYEFVRTKYRYGLKWSITCSDCKHKTYYNYCINKLCRNRLIKHGPYWTYHATQSLHPYNIKCPSCGEIAVDKG